MKSKILLMAFALLGVLTISSCSDDKDYFTFPLYEIGVSSQEIHVGDEVTVGLNLKNKPGQFVPARPNAWEFDPQVEVLSGGGDNIKFKPTLPGYYTVSVKLYIKNFLDAKPSDAKKAYDVNGTINTITAAGAINSEMVVSKRIRVWP